MDYVVAGFGIGAILALIGFALWELFGNVEEPGTSWLGRAAIGLMLGALVIWSVTGVSLISNIDDSTGSHLVLLTTLVTLVAITAGSLWYWRVDRELAASRPRPVKVSAQREIAPMAAVAVASEDIELTEWDSWPERERVDQPQAASDQAMPDPSANFEPEVAAATAPVPAEEIASDEIDTVETVGAETIPEDVAPIVVATVDTDAEVVATAETDTESDLPTNIRQFRPTLPSESSESAEPIVMEDVLIAETVDLVPPYETVEEDDDVEVIEVIDTAQVPEVDAPAEDDEEELLVAERNEAPVAFESALLADVDGSLADDDGYRSPLLSDLGSDQLEGVGLAKWRPDARLTGQKEEEAAPPASSSRRR